MVSTRACETETDPFLHLTLVHQSHCSIQLASYRGSKKPAKVARCPRHLGTLLLQCRCLWLCLVGSRHTVVELSQLTTATEKPEGRQYSQQISSLYLRSCTVKKSFDDDVVATGLRTRPLMRNNQSFMLAEARSVIIGISFNSRGLISSVYMPRCELEQGSMIDTSMPLGTDPSPPDLAIR